MSGYRIQSGAGHRLDEIFVYTRDTWGDVQADNYIRGIFACFEDIAARRFPWRAIPAEFGVDGYVCRNERHYIYWRLLGGGDVGIVTILHERMHRLERLREEFGA